MGCNGSCSINHAPDHTPCTACAAKLAHRAEKAMGSAHERAVTRERWSRGPFSTTAFSRGSWPQFTGYAAPMAVDGGIGGGMPSMPPAPSSAPQMPLAPPRYAALPMGVPQRDHSIARQKSLGAIPGGWTATEWATLTPDQQTAVLKADANTQTQVREAILAGAKSAVDIIVKAIETADAAADRENATEIEKIRAKLELDKAKLAAQTQIELAKLGLPPTPTTPPQTKDPTPATPLTPPPEKAADNTAMYVVAAVVVVAAGALYMNKSGSRRMRRAA